MTATARRTGRLPARPATFAPDPHRRAMIAKLQIAKKQLHIDDDDYRELLARHSNGKRSSTELSEAQLHAVIEELKAKGFVQTTAANLKRRPAARLADHPAAKKARAMWISLGQLGAIADPSEAALEAFGRRQLGCAQLQWANGVEMFKLVEALKAMATRAGWDQDMAGVAPLRQLWALKLRLAERLHANLVRDGFAPASWSLPRLLENDGVWVGGELPMHWTLDGLDKVIAHLVKARSDAMGRSGGR